MGGMISEGYAYDPVTGELTPTYYKPWEEVLAEKGLRPAPIGGQTTALPSAPTPQLPAGPPYRPAPVSAPRQLAPLPSVGQHSGDITSATPSQLAAALRAAP